MYFLFLNDNYSRHEYRDYSRHGQLQAISTLYIAAA